MNIYKKRLLSRLYRQQAEEVATEGSGTSYESSSADSTASDASESAATESQKQSSKISDAEAKLVKEVMDKKNALKRSQEKLAELESRLKDFDGIDPVQVRALLQSQKDEEQKKLEQKGEWDKLKSQIVEESSKKIDLVSQELQKERELVNSLQSTIAELTIGNSFVSSRYIAENLALTPTKTRIIYGSHFEFKDGSVVAYDKPASAKERTVLVGADGEPLGFEDAIRRIIESDPEKDHVIRAKVKAGAASNPDANSSAPQKTSVVQGKERILAALEQVNKKK